ncbi:MAG: thioredoxin domain-containing protein [Rhizobium sp.]|nr:thioredoxin domain-containing protein [Rhizobium sp.]
MIYLSPVYQVVSRLFAGLAILCLFAGHSFGSELLEPVGRIDRPIGNASAPVTIIEYSSPTCPSCVTYRTQVAPLIEEELVKTGKVRILFRPIARNAVDLAIFMLAEKRTGDEYQALVDLFYSRHADIAASSNMEATIREIAASAGIGRLEFDRLVSDSLTYEALERLKDQAMTDFGVQGTPTFFINGTRVPGAQSAVEMKARVEDALDRE